jgi:hypothetical protein
MKEETCLLVRDATDSLLVIRNLQPSDVILLLTPLVRQFSDDPSVVSDPFECFGRALESRHSRIRHTSYGGINGAHVALIKLANLVILVANDASHIDSAHITRVAAGDEKPVIIIITNNSLDLLENFIDFPTVIQSKDYSEENLEGIALAMFERVGKETKDKV